MSSADHSSPTSGGTGDHIRTLDTFSASGTGTQSVEVATSGLRRVGPDGIDRDNVGPGNELDVYDAKLFGAIQSLWPAVGWLQRIARALARPLQIEPISGAVATITGVAATTTAVALAEHDPGRRTLKVHNDITSTGNLYVRIGAGSASTGSGGYSVMLAPGDYYEAQDRDVALAMSGVWDSSSAGFANVTRVL